MISKVQVILDYKFKHTTTSLRHQEGDKFPEGGRILLGVYDRLTVVPSSTFLSLHYWSHELVA